MRDRHLHGLINWLVLFCLNIFGRNMAIWKAFRNRAGARILDIGCGRYSALSQLIKTQNFYAIGLDIFEPNVRASYGRGIYKDVICGDVRALPIKDKQFDLVIIVEVLEHLDKEDGQKAFSELERVSREAILLTTPIRKCPHHDYYGNPYEEHRYIWSLEELKASGFVIRGKGIRGLTVGDRWWNSPPILFRPLQYIIYMVGTAFSYFFPTIAPSVIAWKYLDTRWTASTSITSNLGHSK
jgi:SAM-dependent methyltransferase